MRLQRLFTFFSLAALYLSLGTVLFTLTQCGKRPPPLPPPVATTPSSPSAGTGADASGAARPAPELDLRIEPESIHPGESALLTWESRHAETVTIEPAIGAVDLSGRIKFYPEDTTSYTISATGPGGSISKEVTVRVSAAGQRPPSFEETDLRHLPLQEQFQAAVKPVFFSFDSAELSDEARKILDQNVAWLTRPEAAQIQFVLEGHTDERGSEEYNLSLGDKRATVVRDFLRSRGIPTSRMTAMSLGEERPFDPGTTEEAYAANRRTQFVMLQEVP